MIKTGYKLNKSKVDKRLNELGMTKRGVSYAITNGLYGNWLQRRISPSGGTVLLDRKEAEQVARLLKVELSEIATFKEIEEKPKSERDNRLERIENKLDLLLNELGIGIATIQENKGTTRKQIP